MKKITSILASLVFCAAASAQSNHIVPLTPEQTSRVTKLVAEEKAAADGMQFLEKEIKEQYLVKSKKLNKAGKLDTIYLPGFDGGYFRYSDDYKYVFPNEFTFSFAAPEQDTTCRLFADKDKTPVESYTFPTAKFSCEKSNNESTVCTRISN